ncbi:MAG: hypothetical protein HY951_07960 [Bacteroidia bacterium]|nr:hypothetical protein [Bacteroidia bacterium]
MIKEKIKYGLFILMFCSLIFPDIQKKIKIFDEAGLDGVFTLADKPKFSKDGWFSGEFQEQFNKYVEDHIGFRNTLIRIRNQFEFSLFKTAHASNVVVGKEDVLYQDFYIDALLGKDLLTKEKVEEKVNKYLFVQNELAKRNITLVMLIAPGKASFLKENLPSYVDITKAQTSNYDLFSKEMARVNANCLDMRKYFLEIKKTSQYPLFPKCGTHWSGYGLTLVADTLFKYIENKSGLDLVNFHSEPGYLTDVDLRFTDDDIGKGMNLIWDIPSWKMYYPNIVFEKDETKNKPDILSIGDSFNQSFWGFYPYFSELFGNNSVYWYYNKIVSWPDSLVNKYIDVEKLDAKQETENRDIVLIVTTEHNIVNFGFGYIDKLYAIYSGTLAEQNERVIAFENAIKADPNWLEAIRKKASEQNKTLEEMIHIDAVWMAEQETK